MTDWFKIIRDDAQALSTGAWKRIKEVEALLNTQIDLESDGDFDERERNARAREVARFNSEIAMLSHPPKIDIRHETGVDDETTGAIEAMLETIATRTGLLRVLGRANRICAFAPFALIKVGTSGANNAVTNGILASQLPSIPRTQRAIAQALEDLPDGIDIADIPVAGDDVEVVSVPSINSINLPWIEECDPRHIIMPTNVKRLEHAYYIAHLFLRTKAECRQRYGRDVASYRIDRSTTSLTVNGIDISSLSPMTGHDNCVLAEVYIIKDPENPGVENLVGVMDMVGGVWLNEPVAYDGPLRFTVLRSDDFHPRLWDSPSSIEQAWSDIEDLAFIRKHARKHTEWSAMDALWIQRDHGIDEEVIDEVNNGKFERRIVEYNGRVDPTKSHTRQIPVALLQLQQLAEQRFTQNTGASNAARGAGETNKVATAFNIEAQFIGSRKTLMQQRIHNAYADTLLIASQIISTLDSEFQVGANGIQYTITDKVVRGITGFDLELIPSDGNDPLADKMVLMQILREVLSNPAMAQFFDLKEIARQLAKIMRWPSKVLAQAGGAGQQAGVSPGRDSGTPQGVGMGIDTAADSGQTTTSVGGALQ